MELYSREIELHITYHNNKIGGKIDNNEPQLSADEIVFIQELNNRMFERAIEEEHNKEKEDEFIKQVIEDMDMKENCNELPDWIKNMYI